MPERYQGPGYALLYPETWTVEEEENTDAVTLESPSGAFLTITVSRDLEVDFRAALKMMEAEYDEIEHEELAVNLAGRPLQGVTQRFVYLDLIVTSQLLKLERPGTSLLIQIQGEDRELDQLSQVFLAILTSMCQSLEETT